MPCRSSSRFMLSAACLAVLLLVCATPSLAGVNRWTRTGPEGASVKLMVTDPANSWISFAVTEGGAIFRGDFYDDPLPHWERIAMQLSGTVITALAIDPGDPGALYAGTSAGEVFRSRDQGYHWVELEVPDLGAIKSIVIDDDRNWIYISMESGLVTSHDAGLSWKVASLSIRAPLTAAWDGSVYAPLTPSGLLHVSTDGGITWNRTTTAMIGVSALAFNRHTSTLYVAQQAGVWASSDKGSTWRILPYLDRSLVSLHAAGPRIYAITTHGLYEYTDGIPAWKAIGPDTLAVTAFTAGPYPLMLFVGTKTGIFAAGDGGVGWKPSNSGLNHAFVSDTDTLGNETALAATPGGLFRTTDGGESWARVPGVEEPLTNVATSGLQRAYVGGNKGIRKSSDGGDTWELVSPGIPTALGVPAAAPTTVYAVFASAMNNQNSMRRSTDGGRSWNFIGAGLGFDPGWYYYGMTPTVLEPDDEDPAVAYLAYGLGLAKTSNAGDNWRDLITAQYPEAARAVAAKGKTLHVAMGKGIFSSLDGGVTWAARQLLDETVQAIAIDPTNPRRSYAGTAGGRVYRSDDSGNSWTLFSDGLEAAPVHRLAINDAGDRIYAATAGGMFVYQIVATLSFERLAEDGLRLPRLLRQVQIDFTGMTYGTAAFVLPAVGTVAGSAGTVFRTDVTLANNRAVEQDVMLAWLPQRNTSGSAVPMFRINLPPLANDSGGTLAIADIADELGLEGLGSMIVFATNAAGEVDASADIDGFARVRSSSHCSSGSVSQSLPAVSAHAFAPHRRGRTLGLRHESGYRTNVGIVNLSDATREFTVIVDGQRHLERFTVSVPPFSPMQTSLPERDYGFAAITVISEGQPDAWTAYASSVDNASGDAWASSATPLSER